MYGVPYWRAFFLYLSVQVCENLRLIHVQYFGIGRRTLEVPVYIIKLQVVDMAGSALEVS